MAIMTVLEKTGVPPCTHPRAWRWSPTPSQVSVTFTIVHARLGAGVSTNLTGPVSSASAASKDQGNGQAVGRYHLWSLCFMLADKRRPISPLDSHL